MIWFMAVCKQVDGEIFVASKHYSTTTKKRGPNCSDPHFSIFRTVEIIR
jgi:hypothetical protein